MHQPLPILGLHHLAVVTRRPEESVAFYRDVLGFAELPRPPFAFRGAWMYAYGMQIHIIENASAAGDRDENIDSRANHVAFRVADIEPVRERLEQHGIPFREQVNAGGIHQIFFQDPDGYHIEIAAHSDPSQGYVTPQSEA
jgi:catechol 2,3-dioxygenase-like lactoylglutathione lyase family enzyme